MRKYVGVFTLVCVGALCMVSWRTMITTEHVTRTRLVPRLKIWSQLAHLQSTNEGKTTQYMSPVVSKRNFCWQNVHFIMTNLNYYAKKCYTNLRVSL
jgi:hypothetical protein